jgi:hypothetical protein
MKNTKKPTTTSDKLVRAISQGFKGLEKKLVEVYRGISGLISAIRDEIHARFDRVERVVDRLEKIILADRKRRKVR